MRRRRTRRSRRSSGLPDSALPSRRTGWVGLGLALLVGVIGAWAAAIPKADHTTAWVLELVAALPLDRSFLVFRQPPPMDAWSLRPLSLLLMKAFIAAFGATNPPGWLLAVKTAGGMAALWAASLAFLRAHGLGRGAPLAATATLMLGPQLFSCWYLTELDHLGAAAMLGGLAALRLGRGPGSLVLAGVGLGAAVLLKESSALVVFAFLGAGAGVALLRGSRELGLRYGAALLIAALPWAALALGMMGEATSAVGRAPLSIRLPLLEHNAVQIAHLSTPAGVAAVGAWALQGVGGGRLPGPLLGLLLLLMLPILSYHSHYETVYYAVRWGGTAMAIVLLAGLSVLALSRRIPLGPATVAMSVLAGLLVMDLAALLSSAGREDIAARIFIGMAPLLFGLAIEGILRSLQGSRLDRLCAGLLALALGWAPLAHLVNTVTEWQARQPIELAGRRALAAQPLRGAPVAFNNFLQWVGPEEQALLGAHDVEGSAFVPLPAWLKEPRLPGRGYIWTLDGAALADTRQQGDPVYVFWQANRARLSPRAGAVLAGDMRWIRRPLGVLTPGSLMELEPVLMPEHSFVEDMHRTTFLPGPTPLEQLLAAEGEVLFAERAAYVQLPLNLLDLPRRLLQGVPWVVVLDAEVRVVRLPGKEP